MRLLVGLLVAQVAVAVAALEVVVYVTVIGTSHLHFTASLVESLIERGHHVDVVFARLNDVVKVPGQIPFRKSFEFKIGAKGLYTMSSPHLSNMFEKEASPFVDIPKFAGLAQELCESGLREGELMKFLRAGHYDIALTSDYDLCGPMLMRAAEIPSVVSFIPTTLFAVQVAAVGLPTPASVFTTPVCAEHDGSLLDKTFHLLRSAYYLYVLRPLEIYAQNEIARRYFGEDFPDTADVARDIDLVFTNTNEIIEKPKPVSHKIKYIGGIGMKTPKPLNEEMNKLLNMSKMGTVVFSFGTQVATAAIPLEIRKNFIEAFRRFPDVTFLWKYDSVNGDDELFVNASNVRRVEWLPQTDLLYDNRVIGFISHMGLNSFIEASMAGVPMFAIPIFIDQTNNAQNAVSRGMAVVVKKYELSLQNIEGALRELLDNPSYKLNAKKVARMMKDKPETGKKSFVEWFEFAAANPRLHAILNLPGAKMSPFFYYCGDVILVSLLAILCVFLSIKYTFTKIWSMAWKKLKTD